MDYLHIAHKIKNDPKTYINEFREQVRSLESLITLSTPPLKRISAIVPFVINLGHIDAELSVKTLFSALKNIKDSKIRRTILTGLVQFRNRNFITSEELFRSILLYGTEYPYFIKYIQNVLSLECYPTLVEWYNKGTEKQKSFCYYFLLLIFNKIHEVDEKKKYNKKGDSNKNIHSKVDKTPSNKTNNEEISILENPNKNSSNKTNNEESSIIENPNKNTILENPNTKSNNKENNIENPIIENPYNINNSEENESIEKDESESSDLNSSVSEGLSYSDSDDNISEGDRIEDVDDCNEIENSAIEDGCCTNKNTKRILKEEEEIQKFSNAENKINVDELESIICEALFKNTKITKSCMLFFLNRTDIKFEVSRLRNGTEYAKRLYKELSESIFDRDVTIMKMKIFVVFKQHFKVRNSITNQILRMIDLDKADIKDLLGCLVNSTTRGEVLSVFKVLSEEMINENKDDDIICYGMNVMREIYYKIAGIHKPEMIDVNAELDDDLEEELEESYTEQNPEDDLKEIKETILRYIECFKGKKVRQVQHSYRALIKAIYKNEAIDKPVEYLSKPRTKEERLSTKRKGDVAEDSEEGNGSKKHKKGKREKKDNKTFHTNRVKRINKLFRKNKS